MKITEAIGVRGENLSSKNGAEGKTMRNLFGMGKEHLKSDEGGRTMSKTLGMRWLVVAAGAAMLLVLGAACTKEIEVPGETIIVEKEVVKTVEVPGETIVVEKEVVKTVEVPGETVVVEKVVVKEVPGETVVVTKEVVREVPGGKTYVTDPSTGKAVTAPEYGGTITYGRVSWAAHSDTWYISGWASHEIGLVNEMLGIGNWAIDRNEWDWRLLADAPLSAWKGALAESWETPDDTTIVFNIRKGVNWQDKAPMNGRELTAKDVEYNWQRLLGLGKFSETGASPMAGGMQPANYESVTATDESTVVFKLKTPDLAALRNVLGSQWIALIYPPEVIEQYGDYKDWRNTVGTGPYALTKVVEDSTRIWTKNPDYWAFDEKYPLNRLPYADKVITLFMPEGGTRIAALRSGKIDILGTIGDSQLRSIDQVESLRRTDPQIEVWPFKFRSDNVFYLIGLEKPPLNDIRVRQALQMALDHETIVNTYYQGQGDATPQGQIANDVAGIGTPFEEWPEEVKKTYMYDPAGAEALLDAAGYERGADGIRLKMGMGYFERYDLSYAELAAGYWREIGVEIEIDVLGVGETGVVTPDQDTYRISWGEGAFRYSIPAPLTWAFYSGGTRTNKDGLKDPKYNAMVDAIQAATTLEGQKRAAKVANMYIIENQFRVWGPEIPQFQAWQPWLKGYNAEMRIGDNEPHTVMARLWLDLDLKAAMR